MSRWEDCDGHQFDDDYSVDPSAMDDEQIARRDAQQNPAAIESAEVSVSPADAHSVAAASHSVHPEACRASPSGFHEYGMDLGCRYCPQIMRASAETKFWLDYDIKERRRDRWTLAVIAALVLAAIVSLIVGATP